jgi:hypothetical protein
MSKHIRYTCNKKNEPTMREDCKKCSEYDPCGKDGKWCFVGALVLENETASENVIVPNTESIALPNLRDMSTVTIDFGNGQKVDVLKEDMVKSIQDEIYKGLRINYANL